MSHLPVTPRTESKENGDFGVREGIVQRSILRTKTVAYSDRHPTLYVVHGRAKPVLPGPNSTETNPFHHGETTYRVG